MPFFVSSLNKTNRFHVTVALYSYNSQRMSKCTKNISDTPCWILCATFLFLQNSEVICHLLLNRAQQLGSYFLSKQWKIMVDLFKYFCINRFPSSLVVSHQLFPSAQSIHNNKMDSRSSMWLKLRKYNFNKRSSHHKKKTKTATKCALIALNGELNNLSNLKSEFPDTVLQSFIQVKDKNSTFLVP